MMQDEDDNLNQAGQYEDHRGQRIRVRRKRKGGMKRGAKLNLIQVLIALIVGLMVAIYIVNQNKGGTPPPPSASIKHQTSFFC